MKQTMRWLAPAVVVALTAGAEQASAAAYSLAPYEQIELNANAGAVAIGDFDADGRSEIAIATESANDSANAAMLHIYRFDPLINTFVRVWLMSLPKQYPYDMSMVSARTLADGRLTLAVGTERTMSIVHWLGSFSNMRTVTTPFRMQVVQALDLDGDGLDEVVGLGHSEGAILFKSDGHAGVSILRQFPAGARGFNDATVGDLNADGLVDWVAMSGQLNTAPHVEIFHSDGMGGFVPGSNAFRISDRNTGGIAAGDIDGDGREDLVLTRPYNSLTWLHVLIQNELGGFEQSQVPTFDIPQDLAIADLSGDGRAEVVVAHTGWSTLSLYSSSTGNLELNQLVSVPYGHYGPTAIATGDVTGDGCADVVVAGGASGIAILRGQDCFVPSDTAPDPIVFASRSDVGRTEPVSSEPATISGIDVPVVISVSGGEYSLNGGNFTSVAGQAEAGDVLRLRHIASSSFSTSTTTSVTVGDTTASFTSTTRAADVTPDAIAFATQTNVARGSTVTSEPQTISGIDVPVVISVAGGEYSLNGAPFTAAAGQVQAGDSLRLRHVASTAFDGVVTSEVSVGGVLAAFSSVAESMDASPDAFTFNDVVNAPRKTWIVSNEIVITGFNIAVPVSISGAGEYSINGGSFRSSSGSLNPGDRVQLRLKSANQKRTTVTTSLTIGGVGDVWSVTTGS